MHSKIEERKKSALPIAYASTVVTEIETRSANLDKRIIEGYGNMWNVKNSHGEKFMKGAWSRSIRENGPNSDANYKIKYTDNHGRALGLMDVLEERDNGLYFKTRPLDAIQSADDHLTQVRSGTINNFSTGFKYNWDKMEWDDTDNSLIVKEARLFEIAGVYVPSDTETYAIRSFGETGEDLAEFTEDFIQTLPANKRLECRKLITRHISLIQQSPLPITERAPSGKKQIDFDYLIKNLKF